MVDFDISRNRTSCRFIPGIIPSESFVVDIIEKRLEKARELGATGIINGREKNAVEEILNLTKQRGVDLVIETAGTDITSQQAIQMACKGATVVFVGYTSSGDVTLPMGMALDKEITFKTIFRYRHIYPLAIEAVSSGKDRPLTADRRGAALCFQLRRQHNRVKGNKRKISNSALSGLCGFAAFHRGKLRD